MNYALTTCAVDRRSGERALSGNGRDLLDDASILFAHDLHDFLREVRNGEEVHVLK